MKRKRLTKEEIDAVASTEFPTKEEMYAEMMDEKHDEWFLNQVIKAKKKGIIA